MFTWERLGIGAFLAIAISASMASTIGILNSGETTTSALFLGLLGGFSVAFILFEILLAVYSLVMRALYGAALELGETVEVISGAYQGAMAVVRYHSGRQIVTATLKTDPAQDIIVLKRQAIRRVASANP
jgi:hypothetical protein